MHQEASFTPTSHSLAFQKQPNQHEKADEVQRGSGLTCPAWKRGVSLALSLGHQALLATSSPCGLQWGRASKRRWTRRRDRRGEPGSSVGTRLGLRGKEWKPIIFCICFGGEKHPFFLDTHPPYSLFSLERLTVSVMLENSLERRISPGLLLGP